MAEPLIISASTAPTATSTESPPVFGSTPSLGIVSRITPSFAEVLLPELVVAPEVVFAAPVLAAVVVPVVASVVSVVLVVVVVVRVVSLGGPESAPWQLALPASASLPLGAVTNCQS